MAMTEEMLAAIKARAEAATPGPWARFRMDRFSINNEQLEKHICGVSPEGEHDAAFIAHAREDVPALLAEVERWQRVARYLAKKLTHDDGSENSGLPGGKWMGATYDDCCSRYSTREEAVQSWIDEAERDVSNE